jgi:hypothetical protein
MRVFAGHREIVLALVTVTVALFGGTWILAGPKLDQWRQLRREQKTVLARIERDKNLVARKEEWEQRFREMRKLLPQFAAGEKMEVHWLSFMDKLAAQHDVTILKRRAKGEIQEGDVFELPIEVPHDAWQGTLDGLIHFLFELQSEGAMLDVRQLLIRPKAGNVLKGRFLLHCAYTREAEGEQK